MDTYALKNIFKFVAVIGMVLSLFWLSAIVVGWLYHEPMISFMIFDALFFGINAVVYLLLRKHSVRLGIKEGILSVNLIWILLGVAGAIPLSCTLPSLFTMLFLSPLAVLQQPVRQSSPISKRCQNQYSICEV